jgi:hypothetical protein
MEALGIIVVIVLLLWTCTSSGSKGSGYQKGDLKVSRDANGEWYVYEIRTGREIYRASSKHECAAYVRDLISG